MFEENVNLFGFCCSWLKPFFLSFRRLLKFNDAIWRMWESCQENVKFGKKSETFQALLQLREVLFCGFSTFSEKLSVLRQSPSNEQQNHEKWLQKKMAMVFYLIFKKNHWEYGSSHFRPYFTDFCPFL